jgi:hypothetical protein
MSHWSEYDYVIVNRDLADKSPRPRRSSPPSGCAAPAKSASTISSTACARGSIATGAYRKPIDSQGIAATINSETISAPI